MNTLPTIFNYEQHEVRTITRDGDPWFIAKDVCRSLKLTNVSMAVKDLDEDEKGVILIDTLGNLSENVEGDDRIKNKERNTNPPSKGETKMARTKPWEVSDQ
ncbi:BRO-N domain-containing protein, partial [Dictyobacter arantiisoli]|uniref:BRO-N domain-containing protein n=1 Tax=Dictyobacter arantiisoli TaxID=2014874 RepID=UPI0022A67EBB